MLKILWADDQVDVVKTFSRLLEPFNPVLEFVSSGEDALKRICNTSFSLLILDLKMPPTDWGGLWLLEKLKETDINIPVIIISGEGTQEETIKALRLGASDYITKENIEDELFQRASQLLEASIVNNATYKLIQKGESEAVEFKTTLRVNTYTDKNDPKIQHSVLKTIAAFLNSKGGTLFIGVNDKGELVGVENDKFPTDDKMLLHLIDLVKNHIGEQFIQYLDVNFKLINDMKILKVDSLVAEEPAYLRFEKQEYFYIRTGPATNALPISKIHKYIKNRFKKV